MNEKSASLPAADPETYFKRGARIKPALRRVITEENMKPMSPRGEARAMAMENLHKPWARRYLRQFGVLT